VTRRAGPWVRALGGVLILGTVVWWVGTGPFLAGVRIVSPAAVLAALGVGLVSTLCSAWRWRRVAAGLGVPLPWRDAVAAYYRSQFLNTTLPTGVVGDVHRAVAHGRDLGNLGLAARAVVLERMAGLAAQVTLAAALLLALPSPLRLPWLAPALAAATVVVGAALAVAVARSRRWSNHRVRRGLASLRDGLLARGTLRVVLVTSAIVLCGHLTIFVIAARGAVPTAPTALLVMVTLPALLAMALPLSFAGWGPREGVAAWAFAGAGLSATQGVTTAVAYGALTLLACLPGAGVLVAGWLRAALPARRSLPTPSRPVLLGDAHE
jgi:uncharacterized membrane protein YbhN (UPF0104 family)